VRRGKDWRFHCPPSFDAVFANALVSHSKPTIASRLEELHRSLAPAVSSLLHPRVSGGGRARSFSGGRYCSTSKVVRTVSSAGMSSSHRTDRAARREDRWLMMVAALGVSARRACYQPCVEDARRLRILGNDASDRGPIQGCGCDESNSNRSRGISRHRFGSSSGHDSAWPDGPTFLRLGLIDPLPFRAGQEAMQAGVRQAPPGRLDGRPVGRSR
jgi:hypothetical protein